MASNQDVVLRWARVNENSPYYQGLKPRLQGSSCRCDGPVFYSYRTPVARYWDGFVLLDNSKWGVTTSRHIRMADNASNYPGFYVPDISGDHNANLACLIGELFTAVEKYEKRYLVREDGGYWVYKHMRDTITDEHRYCVKYQQLTGAVGVIPELQQLLGDADAKRDAKWAIYMDPKKVTQRERSKARREAKLALLGEDA